MGRRRREPEGAQRQLVSRKRPRHGPDADARGATAANAGIISFTDRATWLAATDLSNLEILVQDDPKLFNQYEIILVNPAKHAHVEVAAATAFVDWVASDEGQDVIADYRVGGEQPFFPNAKGQH